MQVITNAIKNGNVLVSDGAWGTSLHQKGLSGDECPELWNLEHEDKVYETAKSFVDAGSKLILTNSFGANPAKLKGYNLQDKTYEINYQAAKISRRAAGDNVFVLGSIGPTGKMLMMEEITEEEMYEGFKTQAKGLVDGGANAILIETMSDLEEAKIALNAAKQNTSVEVIVTMTFEKSVDDNYHTMMGITPTDATHTLMNEGVDIIGANCGNGIEGMIGIVKEIRSVAKDIPVLIHANAGIPEYRDGRTVFPESPEEMAGYVTRLVDAGANIVGGCCGTTPEHIRHIADKLQ
ncbi:MAG: methionine synthase [Bacteroidetes bacterium]|jgi:5-methyltetrahydrofolate--homocysteine methyltransferase|nr:methionine synthase [Bacteroidota bacterium]